MGVATGEVDQVVFEDRFEPSQQLRFGPAIESPQPRLGVEQGFLDRVGRGDDFGFGGSGDDFIDAQQGDDEVLGGPGSDWLRGGPGDDHLEGNADDDRIEGHRGDDTLVGGPGRDELIGGPGTNRLLDDDPTSTPFQPFAPEFALPVADRDVNQDGHITPLDALQIINAIRRHRMHPTDTVLGWSHLDVDQNS